ncbi:hypothetical protein RPC_1552 [Rhodopseudomonas palustris BisB18]|uniref:Transposase n=1 Tax=Rhodopseudomonas palustris (strain BisB18) TaxID=316056 RepID=Q218S2_RHOPB
MAIRDAFGDGASHGVIVKTYSVTHLVKEAQGRYSPAAVVAVSKEVVTGDPDQYISTSYVERQNLSLRMGSRRFTRLTNGFSKKLDNHVAAVALYVAHYNLCRVHEALRTTPAKAIGVADRTWSIAQLVDAALAVAPAMPTETPPDRRRKFTREVATCSRQRSYWSGILSRSHSLRFPPLRSCCCRGQHKFR